MRFTIFAVVLAALMAPAPAQAQYEHWTLVQKLDYVYQMAGPQLELPELCKRIWPGDVASLAFNSPGRQIYYVRSSCFWNLAQITRNAKWCDEVKEKWSFFLSGKDFSRNGCLKNAKIYLNGGYGYSLERDILTMLGYDPEDYGGIYEMHKVYNSEDFKTRLLAYLPDVSSGKVEADLPALLKAARQHDFEYRRARVTPQSLKTAALSGNIRFIESAVEDFGIAPKDYPDLLPEAMRYGSKEVFRYLIEHGANIEIVNRDGKSLLDLARRNSDPEWADILLKAGAK